MDASAVVLVQVLLQIASAAGVLAGAVHAEDGAVVA